MDERGGRVGRRRRYPRVLAWSIVVGTIAASLHWLTGVDAATVWTPLAAAAGLALLSAGAWEVVERWGRVPRGDSPPLLAWLAFPLAVITGLGAAPCLAIALWPQARDWVLGAEIEAILVDNETGPSVEVKFPEPTLARARNLRLNGRQLPAGGAAADGAAVRWRDPRTLEIDLARELARLGVSKIESVSVNMLPAQPPITYASGVTAPERTVFIR